MNRFTQTFADRSAKIIAVAVFAASPIFAVSTRAANPAVESRVEEILKQLTADERFRCWAEFTISIRERWTM